MQIAIPLKVVGKTSTVAAFKILGATQHSISAINVHFCTNGISIKTQTSPHAPVPTRKTTIG